jgi:opacity protein-like surface antigen
MARDSLRMSCHRILVMSLLLTGFTPGVARADFLIIPFFGVNFGGDSSTELSDALDASQYNWGVSFAWMGAGVFGVEGDIGYSNDFFGKTDAGGSSVLSMSGNLLLGIPFGGQQGFGVRPYGVVGVGIIRPDGDAFPQSDVFGENKVAWNFGGGVMLFFASHVGVRGEVRYFRTFEAVDLFDVVREEGATSTSRAAPSDSS